MLDALPDDLVQHALSFWPWALPQLAGASASWKARSGAYTGAWLPLLLAVHLKDKPVPRRFKQVCDPLFFAANLVVKERRPGDALRRMGSREYEAVARVCVAAQALAYNAATLEQALFVMRHARLGVYVHLFIPDGSCLEYLVLTRRGRLSHVRYTDARARYDEAAVRGLYAV